MKTKRPPIVTVLGHVDHGKTTLLDAIRTTNVASREAGGITQSIGASRLVTPQGEITFIDTPGHAAFSQMRSRGARVADIAILVVAASEGPMPQTKEALSFIREAKIPLIIAFTKVDLANANIERVQGLLEAEGILFEGRGGDTPFVEIAAKEGKGIPELLEVIGLVAEVNDISADPEGPLNAVIIETNKDKAGNSASVIVRDGTLKVGNDIAADRLTARVRGMFSAAGKPVKEAFPGDPVVVLGFDDTPPVGAEVYRPIEGGIRASSKAAEKQAMPEGEDGIKVIIKTATSGALEALIPSLPEEVMVMKSGVGDVSEGDVFFAKASNATIFTFEAKAPGSVQKLAENEGVIIESYRVIYELIKRLEEIIESGQILILGYADIIASFPFDGKKVAGSKIKSGRIAKKDKLTLMRGATEAGTVRVTSIRKNKVEVQEVKEGEECGILFEPQLAFSPGDVLLSVKRP